MLEFHSIFAWAVVFLNAIAGVWALVAVRIEKWRLPALWWTVIAAEVAVCIQVIAGIVLQLGAREATPFHVFYGVASVIAIGLFWIYAQGSDWVKERREMFYGLVSLFLMGMALRAISQANAL